MMKLSMLFEEIHNELKFESSRDDDRVTITGYYDNNKVGSIIIEFVFSGYWMFEDELSEDEYYMLFPDDKFAKIEHLEVDDIYKGKSFGSQLVTEALTFIKEAGEKKVYLNASPMGFTGLNITDLVGFYKRFGFKVIPQTDSYNENKEMILSL